MGISIYQLSQNTTMTNTTVQYLDEQSCVEQQLSNQPRLKFAIHDVLPESNSSYGDPKWTFHPAWSVNLSIPLFLITFFGLMNFKRETIFNRMGAIGGCTTRDINKILNNYYSLITRDGQRFCGTVDNSHPYLLLPAK
mgnify:CR=1 FL=1